MKKLNFGYDNGRNPSGAFEGIGVTGIGEGPVAGDYLGVVNVNSANYIVTRVTQAFKDMGVGRIVVHEALADIYPDASGILFISQDKSQICFQLEQLFNMKESQQLIEKGVPLREICDGKMAPFSFECVTRGETITATAIRPDVFLSKKQAINNCHSSFSRMQQELTAIYESEKESGKQM